MLASGHLACNAPRERCHRLALHQTQRFSHAVVGKHFDDGDCSNALRRHFESASNTALLSYFENRQVMVSCAVNVPPDFGVKKTATINAAAATRPAAHSRPAIPASPVRSAGAPTRAPTRAASRIRRNGLEELVPAPGRRR